MKKILSLLLCLCMLVGAMGMTAFAENAEYEFLDARQAINAYLPGSAPAELVVPAQINGIQALSIMDHCFTENDALESVVLPEGLLFIESSNFNGAPLLRSVTFPETLQVINESVVNGSEVLTEITIPHAVVYIGYNSISLNSALQSVRFTGMAPLFVDEGAFRKNHPDLVFYVPDDQIEAYTAVLPEGANIQPSGADAIPCDYTAPETDFVFDAAAGTITGYTGKAACLEIPASIGGAAVTAIGPSAFEGNLYVHCIILPEGLTTIGDKAFDVMTYLKYVGMPDTVTGIGSRAFAGYRGVCAPELSSRLTGMGEKAFFGAVISDHIELPATLTELPVSAFESSRFTGITLPEGLTTIGEKALYQCKYYTELTIPASVTSIGAYAFAESDRLETVNVLCDAALLTADMFEYCNSLKTINLPGNADAVAADALAAATGADVNIEGAEEEPVEVPVETPTVDLTPYVGRWIAVSAEAEGMTLDQSMLADYGMSMEFTLNEDGTAAMTMEGEEMTGLVWTANETSLILTAEGEDLAIPFNENGGLTWDLGGGTLMHFAKEGTEAAAPVEPVAAEPIYAENPYVGTWKCEVFEEGTLVLNPDGTGLYTPADPSYSPDEKTWIANEDGTISFTDSWWGGKTVVLREDGAMVIGNDWFIFTREDGAVITAAPVETPVEEPVEADTSALIGTWFDGDAVNFTINEDGTCVAVDQYGESNMEWAVVDGTAQITSGMWYGAPLVLNADGTLYVTDGWVVDSTFTFGEGEIRVGSTIEAPAGTVAAASADAFFGAWTGESMVMESGTFALADFGMVMDLTINADGTLALFDGAMTDESAWSFADGVLTAEDGLITLSLMEDGRMCMQQEFNVLYLTRAEGGEAPVETPVETPVDAPAANAEVAGRWIAVSAEAEGMTIDQSMLADYGMSMEFTLNEDGTAAMTMEGEEMTGLVWTANETSVTLTAEGEDLVIPFNENGGLTWDLGGGTLMHFAKEGTEAASVPAATPVDTPVETSAVDTSAFVGTWTGDAGVLVLNADGTGVYTANDSEPDNKTWIAKDTGIEFTDLWWNNTSAVIDADGNLNIGSGWFIMQPGSAEAPDAAEVDTSVFMGVWYDEAGGVLTFFENGELTFEDVYGVNTMGWEVRDSKMMITTGSWWDSVLTIDENGVLNANDSYYIDYNFTREQPVIEAPTEPEGTEAGEATVVAAEQDDFIGLWFGSEMSVEGETLALADIGMIIEINMAADGTITMYDGEVTETGAWTFVDGAADIDGMILRLMSDGTLVGEDPEGTRIVFTGFVGEWKACYMATGGLTGDLRGMGITSTLILNADGTGSIDFPSEETGTWYEEDGYVRFGESGMPMQLLSGGYLKFGSDLAGYVVYSKDENAVWEPAAEEPVVPADPVVPVVPAETPAPAQPDASDNGGAVDMQALMNRKFIAKTYTAFGQTMDGSMLGEYSLLFREDGTCDFGIAGMVVPNLPWGLQKIATGLTEVDAFVINYYGTMFNAVLTENGFDMDYYGTMTLHFVPAE